MKNNFQKGGYKQILGIEGNSSIATDMSVWDGVSAIILVILNVGKLSDEHVYILVIFLPALTKFKRFKSKLWFGWICATKDSPMVKVMEEIE